MMTLLRAGGAAALGVLAVHVVWVVRPESSVDPVHAPSIRETLRKVRQPEALNAQISAWQAEERLRLAEDELLSCRLRHLVAGAGLERAQAAWLEAAAEVQAASPAGAEERATPLLQKEEGE
jgi:hypothetical protein